MPEAEVTEVYVSITGLRLKQAWHGPVFWLHAARAMMQARKAPGNLSADARRIGGVHHTVSVWRDREAMRAYLRSGAHLQAMRVFPQIATGAVAGFAAAAAPDWADVPAILQSRGRGV